MNNVGDSEDYRYCYYGADLVDYGLSSLLSSSRLEDSQIALE